MPEWSSDDGAAVSEFVLVAVLLLFLFFGVMQVGVYLYVRTVVAAAAADGARYGANADVTPAAGAARARALIGSGLAGEVASGVPCSGSARSDAASGLRIVTVRCAGNLKAFFLPLSVPLRIDVRSSALREVVP